MNAWRCPRLALRTTHSAPDTSRRAVATATLALSVGIGLGGCAGSAPAPLIGPAFPPHPLRPLRVAIAPPHRPLELPVLHESLATWSHRASERRRLVACTWQEGVPTLANLAWPATELSAVVMARWPLGQTADWCDFAGDDPDSFTCTLTAPQPIDYARRRGLSHLVVPRALVYTADVTERDTVLLLASDLAVVDIIEGRVVWTGRVAARRDDVRRFRDLQPDITDFERATYAWLVDLARVFDRVETWPEHTSGLRDVALRCHPAPSVFPFPKLLPSEVAGRSETDATTNVPAAFEQPAHATTAPSTQTPATVSPEPRRP